MREVIARSDKICSYCKEEIAEGEECVQSEGRYNLFYHPGCAVKRFGNIIKWKKSDKKINL